MNSATWSIKNGIVANYENETEKRRKNVLLGATTGAQGSAILKKRAIFYIVHVMPLS